MATLKDTVVHDWLGVMSGITLGDDKFNAISLDEDGNIIIGDSNANGTILDGSVILSNGTLHSPDNIDIGAGYSTESDSSGSNTSANLKLHSYGSVNIEASNSSVTVTASSGAVHLYTGSSTTTSDDGGTSYTYYNGRFYATGNLYLKAGYDSSDSATNSSAATLYLQGRKSVNVTADSNDVTVTANSGAISLTSGTSNSNDGNIALTAHGYRASTTDTTGTTVYTYYPGDISLTAGGSSTNNTNTGNITLTAYGGGASSNDGNISLTAGSGSNYTGSISLTANSGAISLTSGTRGSTAGSISLTSHGSSTAGSISLTSGSSSYAGSIGLTAYGGISLTDTKGNISLTTSTGTIEGSASSISLTSNGTANGNNTTLTSNSALNLLAVQNGSSINIVAGNYEGNTRAYGNINLTAHGSTSSTAGNINLTAGNSNSGGYINLFAYSDIGLTCTNSSVSLTTNSVSITAGSSNSTGSSDADGICLYSDGRYNALSGSDIRYWGALINAYNGSIQLYSGGLRDDSGNVLCYQDSDIYAIRVRANGDVHVEAGFGLYPQTTGETDVKTNSGATLTLASAGKLNINAETALYLGSSSAMFGTSTPTTNNDTGRIFLVYDSSVSDNWHPCTVYVYSPQN